MADLEPTQTDLSRVIAMDLNLLAPLLAVLEERSVTRAAERVGLSQPAMSHALRRIRRLLGDEVLVRRGNEFTLTPRAVGLVGPLRRVLLQTSALVAQDTFDPETTTRTITLAMTSSTAFVASAVLSRALLDNAPDARVRIHTTRDTTDAVFTQQRADVLFLAEGIPTPHPRERLYHDRWVVVTGRPWRPGESTLDALERRPHVVFDGERRTRPYDVLDEHGLRYTVVELVNDNLLVPPLVAGTGRIALQRHSVAVGFQRMHELYLAEFPFPLQGLAIDLVWNPWLPDRAFRDWLGAMLHQASAPYVFTSRMPLI